MSRIFSNIYLNQKGQSMVEYSLIITLVILVAVFSLQQFGYSLEDLFEYMRDRLGDVM